MPFSRLIVTTAAGALFASSSFAADMPVYDKAPTIAPPAPVFYDWTGVYAGLHGGYFWGDVSLPPGGLISSVDIDGFLAGGQIGANWQIDRFVFGVEGDIAWSGADGSSSVPIAGAATLSASSELEWLATVRARAGIAIDRVLIYGTGGVAFANHEITATNPFGSNSDDQTHVGWTIGAGVEAMVTENLSVKLEYLYVDLGEETYIGNVPAPPFPIEIDGHVVRAGLNYRFNLF